MEYANTFFAVKIAKFYNKLIDSNKNSKITAHWTICNMGGSSEQWNGYSEFMSMFWYARIQNICVKWFEYAAVVLIFRGYSSLVMNPFNAFWEIIRYYEYFFTAEGFRYIENSVNT